MGPGPVRNIRALATGDFPFRVVHRCVAYDTFEDIDPGPSCANCHKNPNTVVSVPSLKLSRLPITVFCALTLFATANGHGATFWCPADAASVTAEQRDHVRPVCHAARRARRMLADCGIRQREPVRVFVVNHLVPEFPEHDLGFFDSHTDRVVVPTYEKSIDVTEKMDRFGVPMTRRLYRSLLIHEVTHAIVNQNVGTTRLNVAGYEYISYTIQFLSMGHELRGKILEKYPHDSPVKVKELSESYFYLSPPDFAVKSYIHFDMPANACSFVRDLLRGNRSLPSGVR